MEYTNKKYLWSLSLFGTTLFVVIVIILGFITPDYSHLRNTISLLSIKKYGVIQQINFIQFGISLGLASFLIYKQLKNNETKKIWRNIISFCLLFFLTITIFPTNEISKLNDLNQIPPSGIIHISTLILFFILAPLGIMKLSKTFESEAKFSTLAKTTLYSGILATTLCYLWVILFSFGLFTNVLGIFQKIIALIVLSWFYKMLLAVRPQ